MTDEIKTEVATVLNKSAGAQGVYAKGVRIWLEPKQSRRATFTADEIERMEKLNSLLVVRKGGADPVVEGELGNDDPDAKGEGDDGETADEKPKQPWNKKKK